MDVIEYLMWSFICIQTELRFVENYNYKTMKSGKTVKDFEKYVQDVHEK